MNDSRSSFHITSPPPPSLSLSKYIYKVSYYFYYYLFFDNSMVTEETFELWIIASSKSYWHQQITRHVIMFCWWEKCFVGCLSHLKEPSDRCITRIIFVQDSKTLSTYPHAFSIEHIELMIELNPTVHILKIYDNSYLFIFCIQASYCLN